MNIGSCFTATRSPFFSASIAFSLRSRACLHSQNHEWTYSIETTSPPNPLKPENLFIGARKGLTKTFLSFPFTDEGAEVDSGVCTKVGEGVYFGRSFGGSLSLGGKGTYPPPSRSRREVGTLELGRVGSKSSSSNEWDRTRINRWPG